MLICIAPNCTLPARWRAIFAGRPAVHWGEKEHGLALDLCFCELHKSEATLDALFSPRARQHIDGQFMARGLPPPDWARSALRFAALKPEQLKRALFTFTVYNDPTDFPGKYVVRKHAAVAGAGDSVFPQELVAVEDSLEAARAKIPGDRIRMARQPEDDPKIVEVWV